MHTHDLYDNAFCSKPDCVTRQVKPARLREFTKELSSLKMCLTHTITLIKWLQMPRAFIYQHWLNTNSVLSIWEGISYIRVQTKVFCL